MISSPLQGTRPGLPIAFALGALACLGICAGMPASAVAADAALLQSSAQTVAVTALRVPALVSDTVAEVTVLSREDLDRATGLTLTELLARQPGLQFASNGGPGQSSELFMRGLEARHTVLLLDGVRVGSATLGLPSFDNLPVSLIDHVEIVRGPLSSLYGSDAAGGVVQVFTRRGREGLAFDGATTLGSLGYVQARAGLAYGHDGFDLALDLQHASDRGFSATNPQAAYGNYDPDRDGFRQNAMSARAGWQLNRDWRLEALTLDASGQAHYDDGPGADARALLVDRVQSLKLSGRVIPDWGTTLSASRSTDDYDTQASASPYASLGTIGTVQQTVSWENSLATPAGTLLAVLDATSQQVSRPGESFDVSRRRIYGAALALDGRARDFDWQASLRRDHDSQFGEPTTGALALAYALTAEWRVGASCGTSFVAPSFNQLYYPGYGNPALQPERGRSTELNARWASGGDQVRASFYRSRIRGFITSGEEPANVSLARVDGVTLDGETRWRSLVLQASIDHLDPRSDSLDGSGTSRLLPRRARNAVRANALWSLESATVGVAVAAVSRRYDDTENTIALAGYGTVDLFADKALSREWSLGARMNNVGGKVYETAHGYNQPGREVYVTLRYTPA